MTIQLIQGQFSAHEASDIITKMVRVKIKFHEDKIYAHANEEDINMREKRINQLQKKVFEVRNFIDAKKEKIEIHSLVEIN